MKKLESGMGLLRVALFMTDLDDLGVQRVVINLYNHFDRSAVDPTLILWNDAGKVAHFVDRSKPIIETDPGLRRPRLLFRLFRYLSIVRRIRPDAILSFVPATNVSLRLLRPFLPKRVPVVMCEHAFISRAFAVGEYTGFFKHLYKTLLRGMYNRADRLVMTADLGKRDIVEAWGVEADRVSVIRNPQDIAELRSRAGQECGHDWLVRREAPVLIAAGRLAAQKGFSKLLDACALLAKERDFRLIILGRGELEAELRSKASDLGLAGRVDFAGFQTNHLQYIARADLFVLSSVWEAMPMVVAETMAVGTPIVSFDCPSGPYEMLDAGRCGYLVPDQDERALADAIAHALDHPEEAKAKARLAREKVEQYDVGKIVAAYQDLLREAWLARQPRARGAKGRP